MSQLKMYFLPGTPVRKYDLPAGYSFSNYRTPADISDWMRICSNGLIADNDAGAFDSAITAIRDIVPGEDVFFLDYNGEHVATVTAFVYSANNIGDVHMVSVREDFRGRGLAKFLNMVALSHLEPKKPKWIQLTTDEWRKGAVKSYINAGFLPVEYDTGMEERWTGVLKELGVPSIDMLNEDASFYKCVDVSKMQ